MFVYKKENFENIEITEEVPKLELNGIPEFLDSGRWTQDSGHWTLDAGLWTLDAAHRKLGSGH